MKSVIQGQVHIQQVYLQGGLLLLPAKGKDTKVNSLPTYLPVHLLSPKAYLFPEADESQKFIGLATCQNL